MMSDFAKTAHESPRWQVRIAGKWRWLHVVGM